MFIGKLRKIIALLLMTVTLFTLSACGKKEDPAPKNTEDPATLTIKNPEEKIETVPVSVEDE